MALCVNEERSLAEQVKEYPCLYDKFDVNYRLEEETSKCWNDVARKLDFVKDGDEASRLFFMLKKRYLKKRNLVKKSNYMQSKSRILDKAKRDLEQYSFMNWLDQYLRVRRCKSEIRGGYFYESHVKRENHTKREDGSSSSQGNWERTSSMHADWGGSQANREWNGEDVPIVTCLPNDSIDEMELYEDDDDDDIDTIGDHDKMERIKCSPLVQVYKDSRRPPSVVSSDEIINVKSTTSMTKMNNDPLLVVDPTPSMHKHYLDRFHSSEQSKLSPTFEPSPSSSRVHMQHAFDKQPIDVLQGLFAKSLAAELTNLPEYERCLAQHEINQVLFKYKMIVLQKSKQTNEK